MRIKEITRVCVCMRVCEPEIQQMLKRDKQNTAVFFVCLSLLLYNSGIISMLEISENAGSDRVPHSFPI